MSWNSCAIEIVIGVSIIRHSTASERAVQFSVEIMLVEMSATLYEVKESARGRLPCSVQGGSVKLPS